MPRETAKPKKRAKRGTPRDEGAEPPRSIMGVATEAARTGVVRGRIPSREEELPGEDRDLGAGDPDVSGIEAGHVGESTPGGSTPTPDQAGVDDIGRALGLEDVDRRRLRSSTEVLAERDRRRGEEEPEESGEEP
jgi:hypothetical protein